MTHWVQSQNELDSKTSSQTLIFESNVYFLLLIFSKNVVLKTAKKHVCFLERFGKVEQLA